MSAALRRNVAMAGGVIALVAVALAIGFFTPGQPLLALGIAVVVLLLGITAAEPAAVPLVALPFMVSAYRVSFAGTALSASDVALAIATGMALIFAPRPFSPALRNLLWLNLLYQFATLFTVALNPFTANTVEWFHAWFLVSGALLVGWAVGRRGVARTGLSLLLVSCLVIAMSTIAQGVLQWSRGDRAAVYTTWPFGMHKNLVGCLMGLAALMVFTRPNFLGWSRKLAWPALGVFLLALLFTQSRQAVVALGVAVLYVAYRRGVRGRSLLLLTVLPVLVFVATLVQDQFESGNRFNSANQRVEWFRQSFEAWQTSPWVGLGLRFWYRPDAPVGFQPPNAELEVLVSAGLLGVVAFVLMMCAGLLALHRLPGDAGVLATAVLGSRVVQGQFDLFWVAVQTSVPFAIVGVCLGAQAFAAEADPWHLGGATSVRAEDAGAGAPTRVLAAGRTR